MSFLFTQQSRTQSSSLTAHIPRCLPNRPPDILPTQPTPGYVLPRTTEIARTKRARAKRSCDLCRKKKTRCNSDLLRPCTTCRNAGTECQFLVDQKKRGPSVSYVETLEKRVMRMEGIIQTMAKRRRGPETGESMISDSEQDTSGTKDLLSTTPIHIDSDEESAQNSGQPHNIHRTEYDQTPSTASSVDLHTTDPELFRSNTAHFDQKDSSLNVQSVIDVDDERDTAAMEETRKHRNLDKQTYSGPAHDIIETTPYMTREYADSLIQIYFQYIHPFCPILNKIGFLEQYYYQNPCPPDEYLLSAILAISSHFLPHVSDFSVTTENMLAMQTSLRKRTEKLLEVLFKRSDISTIQTLMLLSLFVNSEKSGVKGTMHWFTMGMAIRMAQDLGLHRHSSSWQIPEHEAELRRRIWFCMYKMDKWVSAELDQPLTILDGEFDVEMPSAYEIDSPHRTPYSETTPQLIKEADEAIRKKIPVYECFTYLIALSEILGQVLSGLHARKSRKDNEPKVKLAQSIDKQLKAWKATLPLAYQLDSGPNASMPDAGLMDIAYWCTLLLLHRPFINNYDPENAEFARKSFNACTTAANGIIAAAEALESKGLLCVPWSMTTYTVFQAGVINLFDKKSDNPSIRNHTIQSLVRYAHALQRETIEPGRPIIPTSARSYLPPDKDDDERGTRTPSPTESHDNDACSVQQVQSVGNSPVLIANSPSPTPWSSSCEQPHSQRSTELAQPFHPVPSVNPSSTLAQPPSTPKDYSFPIPPPTSLSTRPEDMFFTSLSRGLGKRMDSMSLATFPRFPSTRHSRLHSPQSHPPVQPNGDQYVNFDAMTNTNRMDHALNDKQPSITDKVAQSNTTVTLSLPSIPNYAVQTEEDVQLGTADLPSEVSHWNSPSGITWAEWDSYLHNNR